MTQQAPHADNSISIPAEIREEWDILTAGAVDVLPMEDFRDRLLAAKKEGRQLRVKLGADPSAPDLHLGHGVVLNKLRQFQDLGHHVVFIVGDFTARIGDPTGKSETRPALTPEQVAENAKSYMEQVFLILDREKTEIVWNGSWFDKMSFTEVIRLASQYTVARMLERDDFSKRYAEGRAIHIHEFLYPLVQGHDSIEVRADIELGGTDQKFNLLVGRELMREAGMTPQCIMTMPLLVGLDGEKKMSKSLNNYIGFTDSPENIYGKAMSVPDTMMEDYMVLVLGWTPEVAQSKLAEVAGGGRHPRDLKSEIAEAVTARFHGVEGGQAGREHFDRVIRQKEVPDEVETVALQAEDGQILLARAMAEAGLAKSNGEARRLIQGGGVSLDGDKINDPNHTLAPGEYLLKVGKRHFRRIQLT